MIPTQHTDNPAGAPLLLPVPRVCDVRPGRWIAAPTLAWSGPGLELARDTIGEALEALGNALRPCAAGESPGVVSVDESPDDVRSRGRAGAYALDIPAGQGPVRMWARGDDARRNALRTLAQLLTQYGRALPAMFVLDWPGLAVRGVMLDISRDRVPTMATLRRTIRLLASLKINHVQLYTEHTFAYAGHEEVWRDASPVTPEEIRELGALCAGLGVELAANQNCLGHMHRWFKHPRYAPLAEITPADTTWTFETDDGRAFNKRGPFSLCPTDPGSIELVRDLLDQLLPCFASPNVNIGCDEAFDIGQGRSRDEVARRGRAAVYFDHLRAVDAIVRRHGKCSQFWGDIALRHPDMLSQIPDGSTALVWGYEGDAPFEHAGELLASAGVRHWVCPGTSSWCSFVGRPSVRRANLGAAARAAGITGAQGMLVTDWGDQGHRQQWPVSMMGLAHGADAAWNAGRGDVFDARTASLHVFEDASENIGPWLDELGDVDADLRASLRNAGAFFTELHRPVGLDPADSTPQTLEQWQRAASSLAGLRERLGSLAAPDALLADELDLTLRVAEHAARKGVASRRGSGPPGAAERAALAGDLAEIARRHADLWRARSRPGGLADSIAHYQRVIDDYLV